MLGVFWFWSLTGGDTGNVTTGWVSSSLSTSGAYHSSGGEGTREAAAKDFAGPVTKHKAQRQLIWSFYTWNTWRAYTWNEGFKKELVRVPLTVSWICYQINLSNKNCLVYPCLDGTPQQCVPAPKSSSITLYLQQEKLELCFSCTSILTQKSLILAGICCIPIPETLIYSNLHLTKMSPYLKSEEKKGKRERKGKGHGTEPQLPEQSLWLPQPSSSRNYTSLSHHVTRALPFQHPVSLHLSAHTSDTRNNWKIIPSALGPGSAEYGSIWQGILWFGI